MTDRKTDGYMVMWNTRGKDGKPIPHSRLKADLGRAKSAARYLTRVGKERVTIKRVERCEFFWSVWGEKIPFLKDETCNPTT